MTADSPELYAARLEKAIREGDFAQTDKLLGAGVPGLPEFPLLRAAARKEDAAFLRRLVAAGFNVNARDGDGDTALMEAVRYGHTENINYLLASGANAALKNSAGETAASIAEKISERNFLNLMGQALDGVLRESEQRLVDKWEKQAALLKQAERDAVSVALMNKLSVRKPLTLKLER
jgi:ankyrin repeat protein